jgi:benzaldehyde dehydrogenase (NAD)
LLDPAAWQGKIYSNGWRTPGGGQTDVTDKSTGESLGKTGVANAADVADAARRAKAAFPAWAATPAAKRAEILNRAADLLEASAEEIATIIMRETGGIRGKADFEVHVGAGELRESARLTGFETRKVIEKTDDHESIAVRVPLGVVGVISPWNVPLVLSMRSVAPALACGNTVVLKPDIQTPICGGFVIAAA